MPTANVIGLGAATLAVGFPQLLRLSEFGCSDYTTSMSGRKFTIARCAGFERLRRTSRPVCS